MDCGSVVNELKPVNNHLNSNVVLHLHAVIERDYTFDRVQKGKNTKAFSEVATGNRSKKNKTCDSNRGPHSNVRQPFLM